MPFGLKQGPCKESRAVGTFHPELGIKGACCQWRIFKK